MRSVFLLFLHAVKRTGQRATLMEVLLVVGAIVVLAAGAYKLYSMVQSNIQSSNEQNNVLTVIANMKSLKFQGVILTVTIFPLCINKDCYHPI